MRLTHRKQTQNRATFCEVVGSLTMPNAARLMEKARCFSRLAKVLPNGMDRDLAYRWKDRYLKQLINKCDGVTRVRHDRSHPDWGILMVKVDGVAGGLHTHPRWLQDAA